MSARRRLWNSSILSATTVVLACFGSAVAQTNYKVTDLGVLPNHNLGCAMGLNDRGMTEVMEGTLKPGTENSASGVLLNGRVAINVNGANHDIGTLGGKNSWTWYAGINLQGDAAGYSETAVTDPGGEDLCGFGTGLICLPFVFQNGRMNALPTLGGNNGQASTINNSGEVSGYAENGVVDGTCPPGIRNNRVDLPVVWQNGVADPLPLVAVTDVDGVAWGLNNQGQATGYSGTCTSANYAVLWQNNTAIPLPDFGVPGASQGIAINDSGEVTGITFDSTGTTTYAAIWPNSSTIISLGTLPGDVNSLAEGINNQGQVAGSTQDAKGDWSHAFIYENGTMYDINTLFSASANLYATMANQVNDEGQVSGMGIVMSGPNKGEIHGFLATPINASIGTSAAEVARVYPKITLPRNVGKQFLPKSVLGALAR